MDDILYSNEEFIIDLALPPLGGEITGFSMDGNYFDFEINTINIQNKEVTTIYIS